MNKTIRTGFDAERKLTLDQEDDWGIIVDATPAERLANHGKLLGICTESGRKCSTRRRCDLKKLIR